MFTTSETVGLAEWIIDDSCLVFLSLPANFLLSPFPQILSIRDPQKQHGIFIALLPVCTI